MMYKKANYLYNELTIAGQPVQIANIPYGSKRFCATIILPPAGHLDDIVAHLAQHPESFVGMLPRGEREIEFSLPRFTLEYGVRDLKQELTAAGIQEAWTSCGGFLEMIDDASAYLSNVFHKAIVEVNEEGTVAAAATAGAKARKRKKVSSPEMTVDHPFMFIIQDVASNVVWFAGRIDAPVLPMGGL
eukprot:NODE_541_length_862_cov_226.991881_g533_i0.p1 GENE.NODE_541_length_862_cov_226.991881_g533_i0~~NODE_541_length_862_cov_226.991881_g533_i0.p1  ORF type:complete len:188 (-),score=23.32 NODE_541_length_862_cov_226.991881_g533_i0:119-682(-)